MSLKSETKIKNQKLMSDWRLQNSAPYTNSIGRRKAKKSSNFGFHKGVFMSQRGYSKYGTPIVKKDSLQSGIEE